MNKQAFQYNVDASGICTLTFDSPGEKVNKFSPAVLEELEGIIDNIALQKDIKALIFKSSKPGMFIAGADLNVFIPAFKDPPLLKNLIHTGHRTFSKIEKLPFPTIAVIDGICLGGGLECALAFNYRIVTDHPKTSLGLPEVTLGIFPGWGGTQRLPRLIGLSEGLAMILSGKAVNGSKACKIHLADALISSEFQDEKIKEFTAKILSSSGKSSVLQRRKPFSWQSILLEKNPLGRTILFSKVEKDLHKKTKGHYQAPLIALDLIKKTYTLPLQEGLDREAQCILNNAGSGLTEAENLIGLFFIQESLKKNAGREISGKAQEIHAPAVIGAGTMGAGIAWLLANNDFSVRIKDLNWTVLGKGFASIYQMFKESLKRKKITSSQMSLKFNLLSGSIDYSGFESADFVIEAATEDQNLKNIIFKECEKKLNPQAILASNTSSLPISQLAASLEHPERFVGLHFFNPVNRMPLVEVIPSEKTSQETLATVVELCRKIGKTPIIVSDVPGFLVNRVFMAGANEVIWMFQEGVSMQRIENALADFGMPMSPFLLSDEVGNDVCYKVAKILEKSYGERFICPKILGVMSEKGLYGKKNGKGFYLYSGNSHQANPEIQSLLDKPSSKNELSDSEIKDRVLIAMINEAARCLEEKVVSSPEYLDMALIMGTGFPPFRGGILRYADAIGIDNVVALSNNFATAHGPRFKPAPSLLKMSAEGKKFYF